MWWCRCCLTIFLKVFLTPRLNYFLQFSSCGPWRVFSHSNSPSYRTLGLCRHTSSSRQFCDILCWLKNLNYCPDGENGNFNCSSCFLKATSLICEAQLSFAAHQKYIIWLFSLWLWLREFVFIPVYISVKQEAIAGQFHVHSHPGVLKLWIWMEYTSEIFYSWEFLGVPITVSNVYLRKIFISEWYFPPF